MKHLSMLIMLLSPFHAVHAQTAERPETKQEEKALEKNARMVIKPDKLVPYHSTNNSELSLHAFLPQGHQATDTRTAVIFFFGGGWTGGTPKQFYAQATDLAEMGMVVFCAEYRTQKTHRTTVTECVEDAKASIRWAREHAQEWGIDPEKIVAAGGSAGGHLAACTAILAGFEKESPISSVPNALVLFNPVLDTTEKGYGKSKFPNGTHLEFSPCHQVKKGIVPTLVLHGTADETVPHENAERFTKLMKEAGNNCTLISYPDVGHGFFNSSYFRPRKKDQTVYNSCMKEMLNFLNANEIFHAEEKN